MERWGRKMQGCWIRAGQGHWLRHVRIFVNIKRSLSKAFVLDQVYDLAFLEIYSIILIHDNLYSAPGLNYEVNARFNKVLQDVKDDAAYS
jgi:hypothetical protein